MTKAKNEYGYISIAQFEHMYTLMKEKDWMYGIIMSLMRYRGIPSIDAAKIRLDDLNAELTKLKVIRAKTNHAEIVELPKIIQQRLTEWINLNKHRMINGYLFTGLTSKYLHVKVDSIRKKFREYLHRSGIASDFWIDTNKHLSNAGRKCWLVRLYDLRASFGTDIQVSTKDIYKTSVMLMHADTRPTIAYMRRAVLVSQSEILCQAFT